MHKVLSILGGAVVMVGLAAAPATAAPNPSDRAIDNDKSQGCPAVIGNNPIAQGLLAGKSTPISARGAERFFAVGDTFCF